jgi:hypothetical protein
LAKLAMVPAACPAEVLSNRTKGEATRPFFWNV